MSTYPTSPATTIKRLSQRGSYDRKFIHSILDEALFCTISYVEDNQSYQIPTGFCRIDETLYIHGSVKSGYMTKLAEKRLPVCISVTLLDGIVLAQTAFNHSVNYRSVVVFSQAERITDSSLMAQSMELFTEKMCPGRWNDLIKPTSGEWEATMIIALPIMKASAKERKGPSSNSSHAQPLNHWAGVIPIRTEMGEPIPDPLLPKDIPLPPYLSKD